MKKVEWGKIEGEHQVFVIDKQLWTWWRKEYNGGRGGDKRKQQEKKKLRIFKNKKMIK